jgi:hypothetical protein
MVISARERQYKQRFLIRRIFLRPCLLLPKGYGRNSENQKNSPLFFYLRRCSHDKRPSIEEWPIKRNVRRDGDKNQITTMSYEN